MIGFWDIYFSTLVSFLFAFIICLISEHLFPQNKNFRKDKNEYLIDLFYFFFFLLGLVCFNILTTRYIYQWGWLDPYENTFSFFEATPTWAQIIIYFLLIDFLQYLNHFLLHRISFFYKFHQIHHTTTQMNFLSTNRQHYIDIIPITLLTFPITHFFRFDPLCPLIYVNTQILALELCHSNIKLNLGPLRFIFQGPQMHIWHHDKETEGQYNFGSVLSIWDWVFKTAKFEYYPPKEIGTSLILSKKNLRPF